MNEEIKLIYEALRKTYGKSMLSKKELGAELGISQSTINFYIAKGCNLPNYKKTQGNGKSGAVLFPILEVAKFIYSTIKVA